MRKAAVIGGGISGIATAYYLLKEGFSVDIYESASRIGGRVGSEEMLGRWLDFGGKNIGKKYRRFRKFVSETGDFPYEYFGFSTSQVIDDEVIQINKDNRTLSNLSGFLKLAGLRGAFDLYPWVMAILKDGSEGMLRTPFFNNIADHCDHKPLSGNFSARCVSYFIRPITIRMNGAEPDECFAGNFGSNLALVLDSYEQLKGGMHQLLEAFLSQHKGRLSIFAGHKVDRLCRNEPGRAISLSYTSMKGSSTISYDHVISALPACELSGLVSDFLPEASILLDRVNYFPVSVAIAAYQRNVFSKGFRAMVFDDSSALSNAGAYGINDLDLVRYTFSGRSARKQINPDTDGKDAVLLAEKKVLPYFNISDNCRTAMIYKYVSPGLCAYSQFHYRLFEELRKALASFHGFYITGDFRRGASIESCFAAAEETVKELVQKYSVS
ncbi:MAG: FAD-dependent oxidoreductase [Chlorobiaceae bacterium]|nr:FAD-dependent oxidoreductase [Chlorobiaceae bacterium]